MNTVRLAACAGLLAVSQPQNAQAMTRIMMLGDSLVKGYGLEAGQSLPVILEKDLKQKGYDVYVINNGVNGLTSSGGLELMQRATRTLPDVLIICLGGNDLLRGVQPALVRNNLDNMLKVSQQHKIPTILVRVSPPPGYDPAYSAEFNAVYTDLGAKYNVPVYPFFLEGIFGNPGYMLSDKVHPNAKGVEFIAQYLGNYLISTNWLPRPVAGKPAAGGPSVKDLQPVPVTPAAKPK